MQGELRAACRRLVRSISDEILDQRTVEQRAKAVASFVEERVAAAAAVVPPSVPQRMAPPADAHRKGALADLVGSLIAAGRHAGAMDQVRRCVQEARLILSEIDRQEDHGAPLNDLRMEGGSSIDDQRAVGPVGKRLFPAPASGPGRRPGMLSDAALAGIGR